jgi:hypothetical protein
MTKIIQTPLFEQEIQYTLLAELLNDISCNWTGSNKLSKDTGLYIMMPLPMCTEYVQGNLKGIDIKNQKFIVIDTIEVVLKLLHFGINNCNIVLRASDNVQVEIAKNAYNVLDAKQCDLRHWRIEENMNLDEYIILGNLPFTDGTQAEINIYTPIYDNLLDQGTPCVISLITPEGLVNGSENKNLRKRLSNAKYGFSKINFLNQTRDWNKEISVDTVVTTAVYGYSGDVIAKGRNSGDIYTTLQLSEYVNGETQQIHDWLLSIQTPEKIKLTSGKKIGTPANELKISKSEIDSVKIVPGELYNSNNDEWRVAFGYQRCNTCAVVPPGLSIPRKYRYKRFGQDELLARKWAAFMLSTHCRFIMNMTYTSKSLDNTQLSYIPVIDLSAIPVINDLELDKFWNCPGFTNIIKPLIGNKVPF